MRTTIFSDDSTTRSLSVRLHESDLDLISVFNITRMDFEPFKPNEVIETNLYLKVDLLCFDMKIVEAKFKAESGTVKDLDQIIESLQKLRIIMVKEEEDK